MVYDSEALPAKTDNNVKNYWNTKLRKKLVKMGIDPVSHKSIPNASRLPTSGSKNFYLNIGSMDLNSGSVRVQIGFKPFLERAEATREPAYTAQPSQSQSQSQSQSDRLATRLD
ncbi:hypothetical protein SAY86_007855 [Trapa natans]|uniref:HTH myb-type domain-containing protein n=1 Tax=Trapa natans TaxID=22666 RepID=A0AAN7R153_TRANT|nr:hypothetical protein SAY86_007855 [Trapa natans]